MTREQLIQQQTTRETYPDVASIAQRVYQAEDDMLSGRTRICEQCDPPREDHSEVWEHED